MSNPVARPPSHSTGSLRIRGIGLGVAGVLFAGLVFGHFGLSIDPKVLDFTRELGLVPFVYASAR